MVTKNSKEQIVRIIAQWVSNPSLKGNCIGIHGSPGVGKTKLIKDGFVKHLTYHLYLYLLEV